MQIVYDCVQTDTWPSMDVQRPDNFIQCLSHYPTVSICAKVSAFPLVQANVHTLTTATFGSVRKPWTTSNMQYILDPEKGLIHRIKLSMQPFEQLEPGG